MIHFWNILELIHHQIQEVPKNTSNNHLISVQLYLRKVFPLLLIPIAPTLNFLISSAMSNDDLNKQKIEEKIGQIADIFSFLKLLLYKIIKEKNTTDE